MVRFLFFSKRLKQYYFERVGKVAKQVFEIKLLLFPAQNCFILVNKKKAMFLGNNAKKVFTFKFSYNGNVAKQVFDGKVAKQVFPKDPSVTSQH